MTIEPRRLLILRAVRRSGGVLAASRALNLTPSAVSQHLVRLEAEAGVPLVDRSRRGGGRSLELTQAGQALADQADRLAEVLADVDRELARQRGAASGPVRIGGFATVLRRLVAPAVADLAVSAPSLQPHVTETDEDDGAKALRAGRLDLLLVERTAGDGAHPATARTSFVEEGLLRDPYRVVVPAAWRLPHDPEQILRGPWICAVPGAAGRIVLDRMCADAGVTGDYQHTCSESSAMLALAGAGLGAAVVPEQALAYLPHPGVRVTTGELYPGARILTVLHRRGRADPTPAAATVLESLRSHAAQDPLTA